MEVMDSGNYSTESPRLGPLLYRQFEEQSSLCDAIIRTGSWTYSPATFPAILRREELAREEKRFHWCVLVASPFFDNIHRNNFLEKHTGMVVLNKWPPSVLEIALLFLYGRPPVVTEENSDMLMDIAEFLLIPELKRTCIEYLKETKVTLDNCMQLYELSSMYGFSLEECENFIKGKLPEVLEQERMLNTTSDSLKLLMADPTLSYVSIQTWFQFLVRWAHKTPERQAMFVELLSLLDFSACDRDFLDNTVAKEPLVMNANEEVKERLMSVQDDGNDAVVILSMFGQYNEFKYFDMRTKLWYRICLSMDSDAEEYSIFQECSIAGVKSSNSSCIYKSDRDHELMRLLEYDLNNAQYKIHSVELAVSSETDHHIDDAVDDADGEEEDDDDFNCKFSVGNDTVTAVSCTLYHEQFESPPHLRTTFRSTLHIVNLDKPVPESHAVLSLKEPIIVQAHSKNGGIVALLTLNREKLFIYNDSTSELECIQFKHDHGIEFGSPGCVSHLAAFEDDFVLYNSDNVSVICILRLSGASLEKKYLVKQVTWENKGDLYDVGYRFDGDRWFRFLSKKRGYIYGQELMVDYVSHNELLKTENTRSLCWEKIPIPPEAKFRPSSCLNIFSVSLPKGTARCHLNCPHCKLTRCDEALYEDEFGDDDDGLYSPDGGSLFDDHYNDYDNDYDYDYNYDSDEYDPYLF